VLAELARHGVRPAPRTPPRFVYEFVKALYTFEIRELKQRRRERGRALGEPPPLDDYRRGLHALRERYPILSLPPEAWLEPGQGSPGAGRPT
jgi:hypothetical protein